MKMYAEVFKVTETLQNGNERTIKKEVLVPCIVNGRHHVTLDRVSKAQKVLEDAHYYNIEHLKSIPRDVLMVEV